MERESFYYVTGFLNAVVDGKNRAACEVFPILHVFRFSSQKNFIAATGKLETAKSKREKI